MSGFEPPTSTLRTWGANSVRNALTCGYAPGGAPSGPFRATPVPLPAKNARPDPGGDQSICAAGAWSVQLHTDRRVVVSAAGQITVAGSFDRSPVVGRRSLDKGRADKALTVDGRRADGIRHVPLTAAARRCRRGSAVIACARTGTTGARTRSAELAIMGCHRRCSAPVTGRTLPQAIAARTVPRFGPTPASRTVQAS